MTTANKSIRSTVHPMKHPLALITTLAALSPLALPGANLFINGDFEDVGTPGSPTFTQGYVGGITTPTNWSGSNLAFAQNSVPSGWTLIASGWDFNSVSHPNTSPDLLSVPTITTGVAVLLDYYQTLTWGTSVLNEGSGEYETPVSANGTPLVAGLSQNIGSLSVGSFYEISFSLANASSNPGLNKENIGMEVWIDGVQAARFLLGINGTPYEADTFTYQFAATSSSHTIAFIPTVDIVGPVVTSSLPITSGGDAVGTVLLDNVSLNAVPEPSAALLGALGLLGVLRRRR